MARGTLWAPVHRVAKSWTRLNQLSTHTLHPRQRNQRSNCQHLLDYQKATASQKNIYFCLSDYAKAFDCVDHNKCEKFLKRWEYQTTWSACWETCMQIRKQVRTGHGTTDWFQIGKEYIKAVYCNPACLTYMESTSWKAWAGGSTGWNQDCREKYQ